MRLSRRQQAIYDHLQANAAQLAHPPTLEELCRALGVPSRGSLHKQIQALADAGVIEPLQGRRGIRLAAPARGEGGTPHLGAIAAGRPIEALPQPEFLPVPDFLLGKRDSYVLTVKGESMIEAGIMDGDLVVIEERDTARNGEIVVALINGGEATLKRLHNNRDGTVTLLPENAAMVPMTYRADQVRVQGVLVSLLRRY
jgi:repressor LexA